MKPKASTSEQALEHAVESVRETYDVEEFPTENAKIEFEGDLPWEGVLQVVQPYDEDEELVEPEDGYAELWNVMFPEVDNRQYVSVSVVFDSAGELIGTGIVDD